MTESKSGRRAHRAAVVVDASGDGDVYAGAGAPFDLEAVHPWLWFRMGNVETPDDAMEAMTGRFFQTLGGRFFRTIGEGRTLMPWGIADVVDRKIDPTAEEELTFAEVECRRRVMEVVERLRAEEPAFARAYLADIAWQLGIYESRRLHGRYAMGRDDATDVVRRCDRGHGRLGALRADLRDPVSRAAAARHARPARRRALHLRRPPRPPGDEGDPAVLRDRRGRRRRGRDRRRPGDRAARGPVADVQERLLRHGAIVRRPDACAVHPEPEGAR